MTRIHGMEESVTDVVIKLAEGNPGAIRVCMEVISQGADIDPDCHALLHLLAFDTLEIYGSRIWMLYKDVCGENLTDTIGMLRAQQLGFVSRQMLNYAIDNHGAGLDIEALMSQVRERLPAFKGIG